MPLAAGTRLGPFEILAPLGAGGMGEVYRALDTRLHRQVALKILPDLFGGDSDRLARFEREAQILASLNHPHIAAIHGIEEAGAVKALVLELVEGPTLADRLVAGPVPLDEVLAIAKQIAEALESAHERGIVHRDLKPANVKVRTDGTVKVLDFGLAKALEPEPTTTGISQSPTLTSPALTRAGVILGTTAYMSPEQAKGTPADVRADIWAFGVIVYEMLSGRQAFHGETTVEVLSSVLKSDPDWTVLPAAIPASVRSLVRRCLQKRPDHRLRDIADARFVIEDTLSDLARGVAADPRPAVGRGRERLAWAGAVALTAAAAMAGTAWWMSDSRNQPRPLRLEITAPPTTDPLSMAISPDGQSLALVAEANGVSQLWTRPLNEVSIRPLAGTENASRPFWSPDNRSIGFFADGLMKRVDVTGGSVQVLGPAAATGGSWSGDGTILFSGGPGDSLYRVSATGGARTPVTRVGPEASTHQAPKFLPDGRHFLFSASGSAPGTYVASLDDKEPARRVLVAQDTVYASGHLLFVRQNTLFAQPFDPVSLQLTGQPTPLAPGILAGEEFDGASLSASAAGPIVYRSGLAGGFHEFVWFDRSGKPIEVVPGSDIGSGFSSSLSRDGTRLALSRNVGGNPADIWTLDVRRGVPDRLTADAAFDLVPVWSPDGDRIAFTSNRNGNFDLFVKSISGTANEELLEGGDAGPPSDWSADGRFILRAREVGQFSPDIWAVPINKDRKAFPVVESEFAQGNGQFSSDGRWIAYQSNESGQLEIYVQPFQRAGRKVRVSSRGGVQARWRQDGRELFYLGLDNRLMAVPIRLDSPTDTIEPGAPTPLFMLRLPGVPQQIYARHYSVSSDGNRFLVDTLKQVTIPVTVAFNWRPNP